MPFQPQLPAQVYDFAARIKDAVGDFFSTVRLRAAEKTENVRIRLQPVFDRFAERLPPGKGRLVLGISVATFSVFLLVLIGSSLATKGSDEGLAPTTAGVAPARQGLILPDELFLPSEPDFVPGVLLEREQRTTWTADDASPLWQDPLKNGEEPWRNRIEKTIDEIMGSVP
jgi:hypothetical protein